MKKRLVGDVAKASAFMIFCGPFTTDVRSQLINDYFHKDLIARNMPTTDDLNLIEFLMDKVTIN